MVLEPGPIAQLVDRGHVEVVQVEELAEASCDVHVAPVVPQAHAGSHARGAGNDASMIQLLLIILLVVLIIGALTGPRYWNRRGL
jgi:hypothetical protein